MISLRRSAERLGAHLPDLVALLGKRASARPGDEALLDRAAPGGLCVIASHDGRCGSLRIQSDAQVHSAILDSGRHLAYELAPESRAWLHIVTGEVQMGGDVLTVGDGAGITAEHAVSLIAKDDSVILLVGLAEPQPRSSGTGFAP